VNGTETGEVGLGKNGVTGIIVPLDGGTIDRVFHHRPIIPIFVDRFPSDLEPGDRAFLYVSGGARVIDGEGGISSVTREPLSDVRLYAGELCLSDNELDDYAASSRKTERDEMLVLKLDQPTKYVKAMKCSLKIPSDGVYMTSETFYHILGENR